MTAFFTIISSEKSFCCHIITLEIKVVKIMATDCLSLIIFLAENLSEVNISLPNMIFRKLNLRISNSKDWIIWSFKSHTSCNLTLRTYNTTKLSTDFYLVPTKLEMMWRNFSCPDTGDWQINNEWISSKMLQRLEA